MCVLYVCLYVASARYTEFGYPNPDYTDINPVVEIYLTHVNAHTKCVVSARHTPST